MSTALTTTGQPLPAHLAAIVKPNAYLEQFGDIQPSDLRLNFVKIAYGDSPQCMKVGWGPTGQEPKLPPMTMFLSRSGQVVPVDMSFIPVLRSVRYICWSGRPGSGQLVFSTADKNDERIIHFMKNPTDGKWLSGLEFLKDPRTQKTLAPAVTTYINIYVFLPICEWPVLLSFKRTSTPAGHQFSSDLLMATMVSTGRIPMHSLKFKFCAPRIIDDGTNKPYYHFAWRAAGLVEDPAIFAKAEEMAKTAKAINDVTSDTDLESDGDEPSAEPQNLKPAQGTVTVTAPVQQPVQQTVQQAAPAAAVPAAPTPTITVPPLPQMPAAQPATAPAPQLAPGIALF